MCIYIHIESIYKNSHYKYNHLYNIRHRVQNVSKNPGFLSQQVLMSLSVNFAKKEPVTLLRRHPTHW